MKHLTEPSSQRLEDCYAHLLDNRVGIIRYIMEQETDLGAPRFFRYVAQACNTRAFCDQENFADASGASVDREVAMGKAIGEAVERYCAAIFDINDFPLSPYREADFSCVDPHGFALYSDTQYAQPGFMFAPFTEDAPIRWAEMFDLVNGEIIHVPAAMVYVPYHYRQRDGEAPIVQPISTGLSCNTSGAQACIGGLCEVIERDAFTIAWQAAISPPSIDIESLSPLNRDIVERFQTAHYSVKVYSITQDTLVPTIMSTMTCDSRDAPGLVVAAATALDPETAMRKSLEELAHTGRYLQLIKSTMPPIAPAPDYSNIVDQVSHLRFWCEQENAKLADFLNASEQQIAFDEIPDQSTGDPDHDLRIILQRIAYTGHRALLRDLTTPDVRDLGLTVIRAVIPGFHPLFMGHNLRALGGTRLWEIPEKLGYPGIRRETGDNPLPHPFP